MARIRLDRVQAGGGRATWPTTRIDLPGGHWAVVYAQLPMGVAAQLRRLMLPVSAVRTDAPAAAEAAERLINAGRHAQERHEDDVRRAVVLGCVTDWCWQLPVDSAGMNAVPPGSIDDLLAGIEATHGPRRTAEEIRRLSSGLAAVLLSDGQVPVELEEAWRYFWMARWGLIRPPSYQELMVWPARLVKELEVVALTVAAAREARQALECGAPE